MKKRSFLLMIFLVLISALLFAGGSKEKSEELGAAKSNKNVFIFASAEPLTGNWDPSSHTILSQLGIENHIFDKLYAFPCGVEDPGKGIPALAVDYEYINPLTVKFKLRDGVKFHDGSDFGAEDVKATLDYYSDPKKPGFG